MTRPLLLLAALTLCACDDRSKPAAPPAAPPPAAAAEPAKPPPASDAEIDDGLLGAFKPALPAVVENKDNPLTEEKIVLGRALYYETRLSASNEISCNTCHRLEVDGADARKASVGHKQQTGKRNSPTVYNSAGHFVQFWDGRAKDLEEQAKGPITNPIEMGMPGDTDAVKEIARVAWYREQFAKVFPDEKNPVTLNNVAKAIAAFERKLMTPSRWDKFLEGDKTALTAEEKAGFKEFVNAGCTACHLGTYVGGSMYQKAGLVAPWPNQEDQGRFEVTKQESDRMMFKVPSLRMVEKTAPYFHDASAATLDEAVRMMGKHQLGKSLTDAQVASIVTWLKTLTGEIPKDYIAQFKVPDAIPPAPKPKKGK